MAGLPFGFYLFTFVIMTAFLLWLKHRRFNRFPQ